MTKSEHRVTVSEGKYTFVVPADDYRVSILRHGEPWHGPQGEASNALHSIMMELDAARVVVQAARANVKQLNGRDVYPAWAVDALALHDRLVSDREPPSAWCGVGTSAPPIAAPSDDPPISLDDLERRATRDAQRLDGLHGDPARAGGWIGHRDYARALVLLIPRLRRAEAAVADPSADQLRYWKDGTKLIEEFLARAQRADPGDVPFPLVGNEAKLWHSAQATAYQHALEMMGWTEPLATAASGSGSPPPESE